MRLRRAFTLAAVAPLLAAGAIVASPVTASAAPGDFTVTTGSGVILEGCNDYPVNYTVDPPTGTFVGYWRLRTAIVAPDGTEEASVEVMDTDPTTGVKTYTLCDFYSPIPGTYTVTATMRYMKDGQWVEYSQAPFTIDLRLPYGTVKAKPSDTTPRRGQRVTAKVSVAQEQADGTYARAENAKVILQRKKGDRWVKVKGARGTTAGNGVAKIRFRQQWRGKTTFRAYAGLDLYNDYVGKVTSRTFTLRTKR